ncbi:MAG: hypothetical protein M1819_000409 [Sarea resinae]|nr:MAG: hypothetical protein M1819_000409 [Sarea resinae]
MDVNERIELIHEVETSVWIDKVNQTYAQGRFTEWVSSMHPNRLPCRLDSGFLHGAYNVGIKFRFSDDTAWLIRFPRAGNICAALADEKVAMEVEALSLIRAKTTIPVPTVRAWGLAAQNELGLGPFVMMDFIDGVSLNDVLRSDHSSRLVTAEIRDGEIEGLYRQFVGFLLQLWKLDFDRLGSLPTPVTGFAAPPRPLTWKVHDILQTGGVDTFGMFLGLSRDRTQAFATATEYFQYVAQQDWEQLLQQANSIGGEYSGRSKYAAFQVLSSVIPDYIDPRFDHGPFKLICDDLGLANMLVRSRDDLTIVGVVDLEWSYAGPAQLFGSAPWWLLMARLNNWDAEFDQDEVPALLARYLRYLDILKRVLDEEAANEETEEPRRHDARELLNLIRRSETSGSMWLHMLLSCGFNDESSVPFSQLRQRFGLEEWKQRKEEFYDTAEIEAFVQRKLAQLEQHEKDLEETSAHKEAVDAGVMTREDFIATL